MGKILKELSPLHILSSILCRVRLAGHREVVFYLPGLLPLLAMNTQAPHCSYYPMSPSAAFKDYLIAPDLNTADGCGIETVKTDFLTQVHCWYGGFSGGDGSCPAGGASFANADVA